MQTNNLEITKGKNVRIRENNKRGVVVEQITATLFAVKIEGEAGLADYSASELTVLN